MLNVEIYIGMREREKRKEKKDWKISLKWQ
jgi:hypothetical protein